MEAARDKALLPWRKFTDMKMVLDDADLRSQVHQYLKLNPSLMAKKQAGRFINDLFHPDLRHRIRSHE